MLSLGNMVCKVFIFCVTFAMLAPGCLSQGPPSSNLGPTGTFINQEACFKESKSYNKVVDLNLQFFYVLIAQIVK